MKFALVVVAASVLLLTGCASLFAPDPTEVPTATSISSARPVASCTADNVEFEWSDAKTLPYALLQATYQSYDNRGLEAGGGSFGPAYGSMAELEPESVFAVLGDSMTAWESTAVARVRSSGLVSDGFDNVQYLVDGSALTVSHARGATWIRGVVVGQVSAEYTATCPDGTVFSGTLTSFDATHSHEYTLNCDEPGVRETAAQKVVREACAKATRT